MSNFWKIYWLTRLDSINSLFEALIWICLILLVFSVFAFFVVQEDDEFEKYKYVPKVLMVVIVASSILRTFTPTQNEAILIMAGSKTLDYAKSDTSLNKIPYQTTKIISDYLQKQIDKDKK